MLIVRETNKEAARVQPLSSLTSPDFKGLKLIAIGTGLRTVHAFLEYVPVIPIWRKGLTGTGI